MREKWDGVHADKLHRAQYLEREYGKVFPAVDDATLNLGDGLSMEFSVQGQFGVKLQFTKTNLRNEIKFQEINIPFTKSEWKVDERVVVKIVKAIMFVEEIYDGR
ncbi:hypothetical protein BI084_gp76 [Gordonia phage Terapin]|uniref:Uncharacterized protein n=4 Tax=Terapinvirus terapin TaxID=2734283 RepID=A0A345MBB5_9CAUD|nr:hypothetical protein BI084_gp76 [Gordonia phage Terapin]AVP43352.1 hypothetical protein PBI_DJOKOVIC_75 [Gordonia phage Djokovic]AXH67786.1 hypothetical protein SEA_BEYONCAGE_75 [Gordonia phage Beyoncage]QOC56220.1 hypothetical protein SEA_SIENNA_75 [Gordonia phage Sienna]QYW00877.1 hypothetical protein SEA_MADI_74 [Gordonia phage Madi]AOE44888.1 hypothetical protein SEA_TERAPIN_76 [Gordonia phage Terapin]